MPQWSRRAIIAIVAAAMLVAVTTTSALADRRNFTVVNNSQITFAHLYVAATDSDSWDDDILGKDVLDPGETWDVAFSKYDGEAGKCLYDVKVIGKGGEEGKLLKVDLCTVTTVTFGDKAPQTAAASVGPAPRAVIEGWLKGNPGLSDPATTLFDWQTTPDGRTTTLVLRPKATDSPVKGVNVAIGQENGVDAARAQIAAIADVRRAEGWQVDTVAPAVLGNRAFATGAKAGTDGLLTLFQLVQANDRVIVVSATGSSNASEAIGGVVGSVLVELLMAVDPTAIR